MADVLIIYPLEKKMAAGQLTEGLASAGYTVGIEEITDPDRLSAAADQARTAAAALLIWSRPLASSAVLGGGLDKIRRQANLIEVSADGITPLSGGGDDSRVVLIAGWRGQAFHPGWQKILGDVKRLSGARKATSERTGRSPAIQAAPIRSMEERPRAPREASAGGARNFTTVVMIAVALLGAVMGVASWVGRSSSDAKRDPVTRATAAPAKPRPGSALPPIAISARGDRAVQAASADPSAPLAEPKPDGNLATAAPAEPQVKAIRTPPVRKGLATLGGKAREESAREAQARTKRYSRKYSKTMRLFCERSGRSTPQCRTFLRSVRPTRS